MKLKNNRKYDTVLFDVDGVLLSEERYFDVTSLTVWELLHELGVEMDGLPSFTNQPNEETIQQVRNKIFQENQIFSWMRSKKMNSNWDMAHLAFAVQWMEILAQLASRDNNRVQAILQQEFADQFGQVKDWIQGENPPIKSSFESFMPLFVDLESDDYLSHLNQQFTDRLQQHGVSIQNPPFSLNDQIWQAGYERFQEWYLGGELYAQVERKTPRDPNRQGFLKQEIPLFDGNFSNLLRDLIKRDVRLGIVTGRPQKEVEIPLRILGIYDLFDPSAIVTATDVMRAEAKHPEKIPLGKPHPYSLVKAIWGRDTTDGECLATRLPLTNNTLYIGDSTSDLQPALKVGCDFAAVLTGLDGQAARQKFEGLATHILKDVNELNHVLLQIRFEPIGRENRER